MFKKQKFDIIIQAGQSNAEGYGRGPSAVEYCETDDILYLVAPKVVGEECNRVVVT